MPCSNCNNKPIVVYTHPSFYVPYCGTTPTAQDSKNFQYMGPDLQCIPAYTGNTIELIIQRIDSKLCGVLGDFTTYNTACLEDITTQQSFVEKSSEFMCTLREDHDQFVQTTFPGYQDQVDDRFKLIEVPGTANSTLEIVGTDTLQTVLTKLSASVEDIINVKLDISAADFDQCFVVSNPPETLAEAFDVLIDQICIIKNDLGSSDILPTFNNVGSCLGGILTSADTLTNTVNKIKTRLCQTPTFDINDLTWGCITKPSSITTDLQAAFQTILTQLISIKQKIPTFSADFSVELTDDGDVCQGVTVDLAVSSTADRYVAVNTSDTTPGTLDTKLQQGTNVTFDTTTTPGKLIINASGGVSTDQLVKSRTEDPTAGFLGAKIKGVTSAKGIDITTPVDVSDNKVAVTADVNGALLWEFLLEFLDDNPDTYTAFCERVTGCLPDCIVPPNVTVIYGNTTTSTTTTTTTTIAP